MEKQNKTKTVGLLRFHKQQMTETTQLRTRVIFEKRKNDSKDRAMDAKAEAREASPEAEASGDFMGPEGGGSSHRGSFSGLQT